MMCNCCSDIYCNNKCTFEPFFLFLDTKDFIILTILPELCKQMGRIKVGTKTFKPTSEESRNAFVLQVPVCS